MLDSDAPFPFYADLSGAPLQGGSVYFGTEGANPVTSPITVYWDEDGTQPASQPIAISAGRTTRSGTPARIWINGDYSRLVLDSKDRQVVYEATPPSSLRSQLGAASGGADLVAFADTVATTYLKTVSDILNGSEVSLLRFINPLYHAGIRAGTDAHDLSSSVVTALQAAKALFVPYGDYYSSPIAVSSPVTKKIRGEGIEGTRLILTSTGKLMQLSDAQWLEMSSMTMKLNGTAQAIAGTTGLQLDGGSGNCHISRMRLAGFADNGIALLGTVGTQMSGHKVIDSYFLGNGGAQLYSYYSNDFDYTGSQFGSLPGIAHSTYGTLIEHSNAGEYTRNKHWNNVIGSKFLNSSYNTIALNRLEENDHEGFYGDGGLANIFEANKIHTNSLSGDGLYDYVYFTNEDALSIEDNILFSWSATYGRWGINIDTGCVNIYPLNNEVRSGYSPSYGPIINASTDASTGCDLPLTGASEGTVAAGTTVYMGSGGQSFVESSVSFVIPFRCVFKRLWCAAGTAPTVGQSFTYTLRNQSSDTLAVATMANAAVTAAVYSQTPALLFAVGDAVDLKLVTSAGAAVTSHRFVIELLRY